MGLYDGAEKDIKTIAEYIVDNYKEYDDGDYSPKGWFCSHCWENNGKFNQDKDNIPHSLDCPYLIAKDLLTRVSEN